MKHESISLLHDDDIACKSALARMIAQVSKLLADTVAGTSRLIGRHDAPGILYID